MKGYAALRDAVATHRFDAVGLVTIVGRDALSFVQSLASQDLDGMAVGASRRSLLLEPQGKLTAEFRVLRHGEEELWLRCEPAVAPLLAAGLARFKIRVAVEIADRSAEFAAIAIRGPLAGTVAPAADTTEGLGEIALDWPGLPGRELIGPVDVIDRLSFPGIEPADAEAYETVRIECGVPRQPVDIDEQTIAQEAALEVDAVSFTKGCFLGQELVCRIDSRGHVNRFLRIVSASEPMAAADELVADGGKVVGVVTSAAVSPRRGPIGLATLRREIEPGSTVRGRAGAILVESLPA